MISYSQNFEDVILERFFKGQATGFYIDIGAADPVKDSVTKHFYDKGWRGINVEPSTRLFEKLTSERKRDININCIVLNQVGTIPFYDIPHSGLSTINKNYACSVIEKRGLLNYENTPVNYFETINTGTRKLADIIEQYASNLEIDFLKIDVEGAEREVIESNDWTVFRPKVLIVESTIPNSQTQNYESWDPLLIQADYIFVYFDGLNRFYLRSDLIQFREVFTYPPCVFDGFVRYSEDKMLPPLNELQLEYQELIVKYKGLQHGVTEYQLRNNNLILQNEILTNQLTSVLNSYSWRVLSPVRWLLRLIQVQSKYISNIFKRIGQSKKIIITRLKSMDGIAQSNNTTNLSAEDLSYNAKKIYTELQQAIAHYHQGTNKT